MGKRGAYNAQHRGMQQWKDYIASQYEGPKLSGPLFVICSFYLPVAKSVGKARKEQLHMQPHWQKPDGDNLEKFLFDCCTRTLWTDDAQVAGILRTKTWVNKEVGSVELYVTEIPVNKLDRELVMKSIWQNLE